MSGASTKATGGRFILGGGWNDAAYAFNDAYAQSPLDRTETNGFRCINYVSGGAPRASLERAIALPFRDFLREPGIPDATFRLYASQYAYDRTPLNAEVEGVTAETDWTKEKVSFAAGYGGERMSAYLFLPKKGRRPLQAVVYFPGSGAIHTRSSESLEVNRIDFLLKSGRAVIYPIYKSTYERGDELRSDYPTQTNFWRDHVIMWAKDSAGRSTISRRVPRSIRRRWRTTGSAGAAGWAASSLPWRSASRSAFSWLPGCSSRDRCRRWSRSIFYRESRRRS